MSKRTAFPVGKLDTIHKILTEHHSLEFPRKQLIELQTKQKKMLIREINKKIKKDK